MTLTATLLASKPQLHAQATAPPFLQAASNGTVSKDTLASWLAADAIYVRLYIQAIGRVLATLDLDEAFLSWLVDGLVGLRAELALFKRVADEYTLDTDVDVRDNQGLALFKTLFSSITFTTEPSSWFHPAVLFFATERIYLDAWTQTSHNLSPQPPTADADQGALRTALIPNWSSPTFAAFVSRLAALLDAAFEQLDGGRRRAVEERALLLWEEVLRAEEAFWPRGED
ncbi:hypothetical protein CDD80_1719 [Ophiocordyceps camponoti-rufipedis]|uniref:Thiaminase-2/PQQC domain-containing protein n=1 Tax=Ophiocordyceps camponoti-rufipedis TaxID=2004952 RepID=A0A2C5XY06_9HYPO|nr:hypothetical protein CDD80_1719 [Ophiocordyceps camponoti-rufipedis]